MSKQELVSKARYYNRDAIDLRARGFRLAASVSVEIRNTFIWMARGIA